MSIWQDNPYGTVIPNITKPNFGSSEVSVSKSEVLGQNIFKISSSESSFSEGSITQISPFESSIIQVAPIEINAIQNTVIQVGSTKFGILKSSPIQVSPVETSPVQVGFIEGNILQISPSEVGSNQNNSSQIQVIQTGTTPINTGEVSFSPVIALTQFFSIHDLTPQAFSKLYFTGQSFWNNKTEPFNLNIEIIDLPTCQLAEANITGFDSTGRPNAGNLYLDIDANGLGWYIGLTPWDNSEFTQTQTDTAYRATLDFDAYNHYDLLTTLLHETPHIQGIHRRLQQLTV